MTAAVSQPPKNKNQNKKRKVDGQRGVNPKEQTLWDNVCTRGRLNADQIPCDLINIKETNMRKAKKKKENH